MFQGPNSSIGANASGGWVLLVGILWIIAMTYICYRGIELSARFQRILLTIEVVMLMVMSVTALVRVYVSHPAGSLHPSLSWLSPANLPLSAFVSGIILMLFIYWGWDTALSVNEETADKARTPGRAGIISTVLLLITYAIVIIAVMSFAGVGGNGVGLTNPAHQFDVLSVTGSAIFGTSGFGTVLSRLLILMVLSSAAASTQTTILPAARTTLSMAAYRALPQQFAKINPRFLTPTVSTIVVGVVSVALYIPLNFISGGNPIADGVTAIGLYIAFYYGLTAFSCTWYYRSTLRSSARNLWMRGILPLFGGLIMFAAGIYSLQSDWVASNSYTSWTVPGLQWQIGGIFVIAALAALAGAGQLRLHARHRPRLLPAADPLPGHPGANTGNGTLSRGAADHEQRSPVGRRGGHGARPFVVSVLAGPIGDGPGDSRRLHRPARDGPRPGGRAAPRHHGRAGQPPGGGPGADGQLDRAGLAEVIGQDPARGGRGRVAMARARAGPAGLDRCQ